MAPPATMKAQVFYEPEKMKLESRPVPSISPEEVLVRVHATGICGSDVAYYYGKSSLGTPTGKGPLILGHEVSGFVEQVGPVAAEKSKLKPGDRVVVNPVQSNPESRWTQRGLSNVDLGNVVGVSADGGLAEYCKSHWYWTVKIPESMDMDQAASTEPLACAVYAIKRAQIEKGNFVVIFGPGPVGLMMVQLAKAAGAGKVVLVGTRDGRIERGKDLGADYIVNTKDSASPHYAKDLSVFMRDHNGGELADRAITSTSSIPAIDLAFKVTGRAATVVLFGLPGDKDEYKIPALESMLLDKTIRFSWLAPTSWPEAIDAIAKGTVNIGKIQTHRFPLEDLAGAIKKLRDREDNTIKTLIQVSDA
ncbi:MAG TPA: alcohol dehydrogenase catalytic domain-containing protein [Planctomycetota bacterium]|nr:alcohol dehydrogenase catalytic domain-containing protein [Planctomycetota bacterium]